MLLDRIRQRRDAIKQIGAEAAERAAALGIKSVNVVHPKPTKTSTTVRMNERADVAHSDVSDEHRFVAKDVKQ